MERVYRWQGSDKWNSLCQYVLTYSLRKFTNCFAVKVLLNTSTETGASGEWTSSILGVSATCLEDAASKWGASVDIKIWPDDPNFPHFSQISSFWVCHMCAVHFSWSDELWDFLFWILTSHPQYPILGQWVSFALQFWKCRPLVPCISHILNRLTCKITSYFSIF